MKKLFAFFAVAVILSACAGLSPQNKGFSSGIHEKTADAPPETGPLPPEYPELPEYAWYVMGQGTVPAEKLAAFLLQHNDQVNEDFAILFASYYIEEAAAEGVNHDMAFAQMCLETGFLRFGGLVTPDMNNFCGLGAIGPEEPGLYFPDVQTGVRAQIQHLQAYAADGPLNQELVDPRYRYVKRGSAPTIHGLAGTWAADRSYDVKIARILSNLYEF